MLTVALTGEALNDADRGALAAAIETSRLLTMTEGAADLRVDLAPESIFRFYRGDQTTPLAAFRIPAKRAVNLPRKVVRLLEHLAAFDAVLRIEAPPSYLKDSIEISFVELIEPATRGSTKPPEAQPLAEHESGLPRLTSGKNLAITFSHRLPNPLYLYVVACDSRLRCINLVYPYKQEFSARVRPNEPLLVGAGPEYVVELQTPPEYPFAIDLFKVFISTESIEPLILTMPALGERLEVPSDPYGSGARLDRDLRAAIIGDTGTTPMPSFEDEPWWCFLQPIRVEAA